MLVPLPRERYELVQNIEPMKMYPIVRCVVFGKQGGKVFVDNIDDPQISLVIHKAGWAYLYAPGENVDYKGILDFIVSCDDVMQYFHVYDAKPGLIEAATIHSGVNIRNRARWRMKKDPLRDFTGEVDLKGFVAKKVEDVDDETLKVFGEDYLVQFYDSIEELKRESLGWVIFDQGKPITLWYGASIIDQNCDSELITFPEARGKGAATVAGLLLLKSLQERGIQIEWDVFPDNTPSMKLAERYGYETYYPFRLLSIFKKDMVKP
jgi:RimJ/RimL family protein N-acetyltransferase